MSFGETSMSKSCVPALAKARLVAASSVWTSEMTTDWSAASAVSTELNSVGILKAVRRDFQNRWFSVQ